MRNEAVMSCEGVEKKIKAFLDDLLAEDEYKAFCDHIRGCSQCRKYVRSLGSLSNLLWKLGEVKVPEDLGVTIRYKLAHPEGKPRSSGSVASKKRIVLGVILILLAGVLFFRTDYFKKQRGPDKDSAPTPKTEVRYEYTTPSDEEARRLLKRLETPAANPGLPPPGETAGEAGKESVAVKEDLREDLMPENSPVHDPAAISGTGFLHWHVRYPEKNEDADLRKAIEELDLKISQGLERKKLLNAEWERLREEKRPVDSGQFYSGSASRDASGKKSQGESESRGVLDEIKRQTDILGMIEEAKRRLEVDLRRGFNEKYRKETKLDSKLLEVIRDAGIALDYQKNDMLMFGASGEKIEQLLGKILTPPLDTASVRDFTPAVFTLRDKTYEAVVSIERGKSNALHWHIDPVLPDKKSEILAIVKGSGGSVDYDSEALVVLSISSENIEKLRTRIQAARVSFDEYGALKSKKNILSSGTVVLSVFWGK